MTLPTALDVYAARRRLQSRLTPTPLRHSPWLSESTGASVFLKLEALNLTGSFKIRGAFNAVLALTENLSEPRLVVAASAGNHGQAIALATQQCGFRCAVFTPADAPEAKKAGIRRYGAQLFHDNNGYDEAEQRAKALAAREGGVYVSPYAHEHVIGGAGTIGLEIVEDQSNCDSIVVPLGGGGLASGIGLGVKTVSPDIELIAVEVEASTPFTKSLEAGHIVEITPRASLADGLTGNLEPGAITFPLVKRLVDRVVTVSEEALAKTMRGFAEHEHLIIEGSAAAAAAALLDRKIDLRGKRVAVVVTGGNVDLAKWLDVVQR